MKLFKKKNAVVAESNQTANETKSNKKLDREARREAKAKEKEAKALEALGKYAKSVVDYTEKVETKVDFRLVKMQMSDLCKDPTAAIEEILGEEFVLEDDIVDEADEATVDEIPADEEPDSVDLTAAALEELNSAEDSVEVTETETDEVTETTETVIDDPEETETNATIVEEVVTEEDVTEVIESDDEENVPEVVADATEEVKVDETEEVVVAETDESAAMEAKPRIPYEIPLLSDFIDTMLMSNARTYEALSQIAKDYLLKAGSTVSSDTDQMTSSLGKYRIGMTTENITTDEGTFRDVAITITGISIVNHKIPNLIAQNAMSTIGVPHSAIQSVAADGKYGIKSYEVILNGYPFDAVIRIIDGSQHKKKNTVKKQIVILELHYITKIEA